MSSRTAKLHSLFMAVVTGKRTITTTRDAQLFMESTRSHDFPAGCIETVIAHPNGLEAVRRSVRADLSPAFLQSSTLPFIFFFSDTAVKALVDGQLLQQLLLAVISPPTCWNALVAAFVGRQLEETSLRPFAWLVYELVTTQFGPGLDLISQSEAILEDKRLLEAADHETRELAYKIQKVIRLKAVMAPTDLAFSPGGRHDNDFADFRQVQIYPTKDELLTNQQPFYRRMEDVFGGEPDSRPSVHVDNQFRLLREDMLAELREDLQTNLGKTKRKRRAMILTHLLPVGIDAGDHRRGKKCSVALTCLQGLEELVRNKPELRTRFLLDNKSYLKHQAFGALYRGSEVCGFAFIERNEKRLLENPPVISLRFTDDGALGRALLAMKSAPHEMKFIFVDTPVFAYEPVLNGLKAISDLPLQKSLLNPSQSEGDANKFEPRGQLPSFVSDVYALRMKIGGLYHKSILAEHDGGELLEEVRVKMDQAQVDSLVSALSQPVSVIQGPPGTGKSFIGSRVVKAMHDLSKNKILVISYTNHALDQFLEDLLDAGIPSKHMVRLGSKSTERTNVLKLPMDNGGYKISSKSWQMINSLKEDRTLLSHELGTYFEQYENFMITFDSIIEFLEFSDEDGVFHDAFLVPSGGKDWKRVGAKGKQVRKDYLFDRWRRGQTPGVFANKVTKECEFVWDLSVDSRQQHLARWTKAMIKDRVDTIRSTVRQLDQLQERIDDHFNEGKADFLRSKRILGCTTTAAADSKLIRAFKPDVILVEEAGEILESHILTSISSSVQQLILIGDHKQLRPKTNNYALTVEKGDGFDLNMSLFERLVIQGHSLTTLRKQHRMHTDLSVFPRALTYPELLDGPKTLERPPTKGLQDRIVFFNHDQAESAVEQIHDKRDGDAKASKENPFEAMVILKVVKYLAQQGYGTDKMVVLTPYLGQLRLLREKLKQEADPVLNDFDAAELVRAGLMTDAASKVNKKQLRLSTIDNYQGEESDLVIASLTRSNSRGDIGFMAASERLNVLITRARNSLVMVGNMDTFMKSKKGGETWTKFFKLLKERDHIYNGLPIRCERHPERTALIKTPADFDKHCPDGGCAESCDTMLQCGKHKCKLRCHRVEDHSKMPCGTLLEKYCSRQHLTRVACSDQNRPCVKCRKEDDEKARRAKRDQDLEKERLRRQVDYQYNLDAVEDAIEREKLKVESLKEEKVQKKILAQKKEELEALKDAAKRWTQIREQEAEAAKDSSTVKSGDDAGKVSGPISGDKTAPSTPSMEEWKQLKMADARNDSLDELMSMIGLEEVKQSFLDIKSSVDVMLRQKVSLTSQRFSCSLLGNPGTGKTTVARLYAKFLTSMGVLPGARFEETTGAKLSSIGVQGCQKLVDSLLNAGGGVLFIDEAYQMTSGNSPGGAAVLDYLLPEVENLRGKIVFVLAGYNKQMESFFGHNPGLPSRFPIEMKFADYTDDELLRIFQLKLHQRYTGRMRCEDGPAGLYCRIVARRMGRGRGREGFGNARTVENGLDKIIKRQATRLRREERARKKTDDLLLSKEDLIGPKPSDALSKSQAWMKLSTLVGLGEVKQAVRTLVDSIQRNYDREIAERPLVQYSLNKLFLGNRGTGKTTVAKIYGQILVELGLLSNGEVLMKNPSDFVGAHLGQSEQQTKGILAATVGKVLVIDDAYGLYGGGSSQGSTGDPYKTAVVDTIVAEVQSIPGDDRCVLLLGYRDQLEKMFQNVNRGLSRRFPMDSAFVFEDFDQAELRQILDLKLKGQGYAATGQAKDVAMGMLDRSRNRSNFGNAGEIDNLLNEAMQHHQSRLSRGKAREDALLEAVDFDQDFDRTEKSETNVKQLFAGTVGSDEIVQRLEGYQETVRSIRAVDMDPKESIPFTFLFRGPPGTGKTTTARKMGKVYYDMGFLAKADVLECSATELIGQYVGQTGPKVQQLLDKALGRILFIDEAYRLADGAGHAFAKEAMDEIVDSVTKPRYFRKTIIILAGYERDINQLMSMNPGLTSRFPETIDFRGLNPDECVALLGSRLANQKASLQLKGVTLDLGVLETPTGSFSAKLREIFSKLSKQDNWASARDVGTVAQTLFRKMIGRKDELTRKLLVADEAMIISELENLHRERETRGNHDKNILKDVLKLQTARQNDSPAPTSSSSTSAATSTTQTSKTQTPPPEPPREEEEPDKAKAGDGYPGRRDAGVSDAVWEQLQRDWRAEQDKELEYQQLLEDEKKAASDAERDKIVRRLVEERRRREREAVVQAKLQQLGCCPAGFQWIKQASGYRCAGGSHVLPAEQVAKLGV